MGVNSLWKLLRSEGLVTELDGSSKEQHAKIVELVAGKVIAVDLSLWVFQARSELNLRQHFSEAAACVKVAFERVSHDSAASLQGLNSLSRRQVLMI